MPTFQSDSEEHESWSVDDGNEGFDTKEAAETEKKKEVRDGLEVEDDDVANKCDEPNSNCGPQASEEVMKDAETMSKSVIQIQNEIERVNSAGDKREARQIRKTEMAAGNYVGKTVGPKERNGMKQIGGLNLQEGSPSYAASFNMGLVQKTSDGPNPNS
ncbi:hypothetical protein SLEP1_g22977 [Rubroshorea leprosula]|uniref:Late embryogenesis abundant protein n=1 Tax=Rubroshorea leprosula TaxID=152421 RepID=A0AAV5JAU2_9ROSI|nr:hypothetical protein SLEP1_g22977 [Rubroshorea leprosula]